MVGIILRILIPTPMKRGKRMKEKNNGGSVRSSSWYGGGKSPLEMWGTADSADCWQWGKEPFPDMLGQICIIYDKLCQNSAKIGLGLGYIFELVFSRQHLVPVGGLFVKIYFWVSVRPSASGGGGGLGVWIYFEHLLQDLPDKRLRCSKAQFSPWLPQHNARSTNGIGIGHTGDRQQDRVEECSFCLIIAG